MLLHIAAEIEHALMVEYLFAAYSLGGPQVPPQHQMLVRRWQEVILGVAKEEMGHLITVQNVLTLLGAPINLRRTDYSWTIDFYPFRFTLERLAPDTLATFVCAESPAKWTHSSAPLIRRLAKVEARHVVNRVGILYGRLVKLLARRDLLPDSVFDAGTKPYQATFDVWGRGYRSGQRGQQAGNVARTLLPEVLIYAVDSRESAVNALSEVGEQGEAVDSDLPVNTPSGGRRAPDEEDSHFVRFSTIFRQLDQLPPRHRQLVARPVGPNPSTAYQPESAESDSTWISHKEARMWSHLFNLRYRMLLVNLSHAYRLPDPADQGPTAKGSLVNRTFGEMYNLRAIAGQLVQLPADAGRRSGLLAGPPFEMPYTLELPDREKERWLLHQDLLEAARNLVARLQAHARGEAADYLNALANSDQIAGQQIDRMLATRTRAEPVGARARRQDQGHPAHGRGQRPHRGGDRRDHRSKPARAARCLRQLLERQVPALGVGAVHQAQQGLSRDTSAVHAGERTCVRVVSPAPWIRAPARPEPRRCPVQRPPREQLARSLGQSDRSNEDSPQPDLRAHSERPSEQSGLHRRRVRRNRGGQPQSRRQCAVSAGPHRRRTSSLRTRQLPGENRRR